MKKEIMSIVKKSAKIGAAVCVGAGAVALMTSGAALKALTEGGKYLKDTVRKIIGEEAETQSAPAEPEAEEAVAEEPSENE